MRKFKLTAKSLTLAGADEEVSVRSNSTEGQVHHRPGVPGASERGLSHGHGPPAGRRRSGEGSRGWEQAHKLAANWQASRLQDSQHDS